MIFKLKPDGLYCKDTHDERGSDRLLLEDRSTTDTIRKNKSKTKTITITIKSKVSLKIRASVLSSDDYKSSMTYVRPLYKFVFED